MVTCRDEAGETREVGAKFVVDATGIQGLYKVETEGWGTVAEVDKASMFTVFEERLGLKLELRRAKVELFVIERVERPSGN